MADGFSARWLAAFELFFRPWLLRRVRPLVAPLPDLPANRPLFVVANHTSWWDPFVLREIQRSLRPRAPVYTIMLERELARRPFFRRIGVVGIEPESPASIRRVGRFLRDAATRRPDASILFFPQGRIWPSTRRPLGFHRGLDFFVRQVSRPLVLPMALHVEPLNAVRASFFVLPGHPLQPANEPDSPSASSVTDAAESTIASLLDRTFCHLHQWGEQAADRWPPP